MNLTRILFLWFNLSFVSTFTGCLSLWAADQDNTDLRVMSFNIRNSFARDGENHWESRKDLVYSVIKDYAPDVLGLQEANSFQLKELSNEFPQYGKAGEGSMGGTKGQYSAMRSVGHPSGVARVRVIGARITRFFNTKSPI